MIFFLLKIFIFYTFKKSLLISWAGFRNGFVRRKNGFTWRFTDTHMSRVTRKPTMWFPNTRSDTNQPVQSQKQARGLKCRMLEELELYYPCSENKGADQLPSYMYCEKLICALVFAYGKKVQVGKDQEKAQSDKDSHSKNRGGKTPN